MNDIHLVNNYHDTTSLRNQIRDVAALYKAIYIHEGVIQGCQVKQVPTATNQIRIWNGILAIDITDGLLLYELDEDEDGEGYSYLTLDVPGLGVAGQQYLVAFKLDLDNLTGEFIVRAGDIGTDPTLTEAGDPEVYYLPLARITDSGTGTVVENDIQAVYLGDAVTTTASGVSEEIGRITSLKYEATKMPYIALELSANQTHSASATYDEIEWDDQKALFEGDSLTLDKYDAISGGFEHFRPKINRAGYYLFRIHCRHGNPAGQIRDVALRVAGQVSATQYAFARTGGMAVGGGTYQYSQSLTRIVWLDEGEILEVEAFSQDGGTRGVINGQDRASYIEVTKVL